MRFKRVVPIVVIIFVWVLFCFPVLRANVPFPSKYLVNFFSPWNAYEEYASPVKNESMPDIIGQIYPWKTFTVASFKNGSIPFWNPYSFSGTPHLANYQSAVLSPLNIGFFLFPFIDWWTVFILLQPLLAGIFTYLYTKTLRKSDVASLVSSISFMFCGFITCWMGYGTLAFAILFLPLALFSIEKFFESRSGKYLILLSVTLPLSFFSGHFQMSLYFLLAVVFYLIFKFIVTKNFRAILYLFLSIVFGLLLTSPQLFPTIELYTQSFRSTIFQKTEVIPWGYLPTFFAPDFFGNPVTRNAWFGDYAEWNAYIGLIPLFFALYALSWIKKPYVLFFTILGILSLLLAINSPLLDLLVLLKIPVLSTSAASRIIVLFSLSFSVLAGFGIDYLISDVKKRKFRKIIITLGIFILLFAALWVSTVFKIFLSPEHAAIAKSNLKYPSLIFGAFVVLILFLIKIKSKKIVVIFSILIIVLESLDMLRFSTKWMPFDPHNLVYPQIGITKFFQNIQGWDRTYMNVGAEDAVYYTLPSVEGYDAVYIRRYGQFIAFLDQGVLKDSYRSVVAYPKMGKYALTGANLLGVKYIVHKITDGQNVWEFPFWKYDPKTIKLLFDDKRYQVLENTNAYPRAFLVNSVIVQTGPQKILDTMFSPSINLRNTAVIEEQLDSNNIGSGSAYITSYKPNNVVVKTVSSMPSFLVLTDSFYPGWTATVDGKVEKMYRTDFAFRGVSVASGTHTIVFSYFPNSFKYGLYTAIIGLAGLVAIYVWNKKQLIN